MQMISSSRKRNGHEKERSIARRQHAQTTLTALRSVLIALWFLLSGTALAVSVVFDVFQGQGTTTVFPLNLVLITCEGMNALAGLVVVILGKVTKKGFSAYQPFSGGQAFVVMQTGGYTMGVLAAVLKVAMANWTPTGGSSPPGAFGLLGCFSAVAQVILLSSLLFFVSPTRRTGKGTATTLSQWRKWAVVSPGRDYVLLLVMGFAIISTCVAAEQFPALQPTGIVLLFAYMVLGMCLVCYALAPALVPTYRWLLPNFLTSSRLLCTYHIFGNVQLALSLCGGVILLNARMNSLWSCHLGCVLLAVSGVSAHVLVLHLGSQSKPEAIRSQLAAPEGDAFQSNQAQEPPSVSTQSYGPMLTTSITLVLSCGTYGLAFCMSYGISDANLEKGLRYVLMLFTLILMTFPPTTHLQGKLVFGETYEIWMPFRGNTQFVFLQGIGWGFYSFGVFFATLYMTASSGLNFLFLSTVCFVLAQLLVHGSLCVFDRQSKIQKLGDRVRSPLLGSTENWLSPSGDFHENAIESSLSAEDVRSTLAVVFNGEALLAIVLCVTSMLLRAVCDMMACNQMVHLQLAGMMVPLQPLADAASFLGVLCTPVAQASMRTRLREMSQNGPARGFLVLQTAGMMIYSYLLLAVLINIFSEGRHLFLSDQKYIFLQYSFHGLLFLIPLVCVIISSVVETQHVMLAKLREVRVRQVTEEVRRLVVQLRGSAHDLQVLERSLQAITGLHGIPAEANEDAEVERRKGLTHAAWLATAMSSITCFGACQAAAFLSAGQPVVTIVFGVASMVVLTGSCLSLHYIYGTRYHAAVPEYSFFMPFRGGIQFIFWQAAGWGCYTVCACLTLACFVEHRGTFLMFLTMSIMSFAAQWLLYLSPPSFRPEAVPPSFVRYNAEGLLAAVTLLGTFFFARAYDTVHEGGATSNASSLVPIAIMSVSMCLAIPMGLLSLQRQAERFGISLQSVLHTDDSIESEDEEEGVLQRAATTTVAADNHALSREGSYFGTTTSVNDSLAHSRVDSLLFGDDDGSLVRTASTEHWVHHRLRPRPRFYIITFSISLLLTLAVILAVPFVGMVVAYSYVHDVRRVYNAGTSALNGLFVVFAVLLTVPMIISPRVQRSRLMRWVHSALCCWSIYSVPTLTLSIGLCPPFLVLTRGSILFTVNMVTMSMLSSVPYIHLLAFVFSVISLGYFAEYHFYHCFHQQREAFILWQSISDLGCATFWVWYVRRYAGRPEMTGRFQNLRATRFFQKYFFEGISHFFRTRIISTSGAVLRCERAAGITAHPKVDMSEAVNQYLFSFHPHGVFPGTAVYATKSAQWEKVIGHNQKHFISVHCADVVFSVPLMREFPMCLGAMSVTRRGIENSIKTGNSPMIITGGQAEMLLTRRSDTELHLTCHHKGFFRVAMRNRIPVVPVLSLSECNILDNVHCLPVQRWFLKRIGFPFPVVPLGTANLPLPTRTPITIIVGPPLWPLPGRDNADDISCVEEMRQRYFEHMEILFYRYRKVAGYPRMQLYLHNGVDDEGVLATPPEGGEDETQFTVKGHSAVYRTVFGREAAPAAGDRERADNATESPLKDKT